MGGSLTWNGTNYTGSAAAGQGAAPGTGASVAPSSNTWAADGDNLRHYLKWEGSAGAFVTSGTQLAIPQSSPPGDSTAFDHALADLAEAPPWSAMWDISDLRTRRDIRRAYLHA